MHDSVKLWAQQAIMAEMVHGKRVLEVGSLDVNGSLKPYIMQYGPSHYGGIDMTAGPGVDMVCTVEEAAQVLFPHESFGFIACTEMMEHTPDWRTSMASIVALLEFDGWLLLTTRSPGFPYHGYPHDYWRYTLRSLKWLAVACGLQGTFTEDPDPQSPGVFMLVNRVRTGYNYDEMLRRLNLLTRHEITPMEQPS